MKCKHCGEQIEPCDIQDTTNLCAFKGYFHIKTNSHYCTLPIEPIAEPADKET